MTRAWMFFVGLLGILTGGCLGFAMNRSDMGIAVPAIWPGPTFKSDHRASIEMFLNGKMHAADVDNILRDTEGKKIVRAGNQKEEKCSFCPEDSRRIRRSDEIIHNEHQRTVNNRNASDVKESTIVSSTSLGPKTSDVTSHVTPDVTSNVTSDVTPNVSSDRTSDVTPNVSSDLTSKVSSDVTPNVSTDLTSKVSSDFTSNVSSDVSSDVTLDVASEFTSDVTSEKISNSAAPRNVVLVLVDDDGPEREATWKNFRSAHDFSIQKFLQNCRSAEIPEGSKFSLSESLVSGGKDECECDRFLRQKVGSLLSWARDIKEMATGAVSTTNFSIPSPFGFGRSPRQLVKDLEDNDEINDMKQDPRLPRANMKTNKNWTPIAMQKQSSHSNSIPTSAAESATKPDGVNGYDGMWDVLDMFSRIRMAFFRILLESLGNIGGPENEFSGSRPFLAKRTTVEFVSDTIQELKANDEGFIMVVAAPATELSAVVQILQSEVSAEDTLLAVAGMCSKDNERVPFLANGPGSKALQEVRTIWDLPESVESVMSNGCHGDICKNKRREEPHVLPSVEPSRLPHDVPLRRFVRAKEDEESPSSTTTDEKTTKDSGETESTSDESTATPELKERSGAPISKVDNVAVILGMVTSITATIALNS